MYQTRPVDINEENSHDIGGVGQMRMKYTIVCDKGSILTSLPLIKKIEGRTKMQLYSKHAYETEYKEIQLLNDDNSVIQQQ